MKDKMVPLNRGHGFTLIEVMVVVVIISVLAVIVLPTYQESVRRAKRADAHNALLDLGNKQQQYFMDNRAYGTATAGQLGVLNSNTKRTCSAGQVVSPEGHYCVTIADVPGSYTLTAVPQSSQDDPDCGSLTYNAAGVKGNTGGGSRCW